MIETAERGGVQGVSAYIWDLDGTLLDSYNVIIRAAMQAAAEAGIHDSAEDVLKKVKRASLTAYLKDVSERSHSTYENLNEDYRRYTHSLDEEICLMPHAKEVLERLQKSGVEHYVFTHRGASSQPILQRLGILDFFREVVTAEYGFPSKPSGDGLRYLLEKYGLDPKTTWYIGDRSMDVLCAKDAGVRAVLLLPEDSWVLPTGKEDRLIPDLGAL